MEYLHVCPYELSGHRTYDCVSVSTEPHDPRFTLLDERGIDNTFLVRMVGVTLKAHKSQITGNPISHRLNAGFNWPRFSVAAGEPDGVSPESVKRQTAVCRFTPPSQVYIS